MGGEVWGLGPWCESTPQSAFAVAAGVYVLCVYSGVLVRYFTGFEGDDPWNGATGGPESRGSPRGWRGPPEAARCTGGAAWPVDDAGQRCRRFDAGSLIGKCENLLVFGFVLAGELTGLAIVFAAKSLVRKNEIAKNATWYLGGTLVNLVWALLIGGLVRAAVVGI